MARLAPPEPTLAALGFTDTEAAVYCELLRASPSTGYRLAQAIGKAPANTYQALAALTQKGAVLVDDGEAKTYRATPPQELLDGLRQGFEARQAQALAALARVHAPVADDRLYQVATPDQIYGRAAAMIEHAQEIVLFDLFPEPFARLRPELERAATRGVTVAGLVYEATEAATMTLVTQPAGAFVIERWPGLQIGVVADAREHLEGLLTPDGTGVKHGVWSDSAYLACLRHSGLASELRVALAAPFESEAAAALSLMRAYPPGFRALVGAPPPS